MQQCQKKIYVPHNHDDFQNKYFIPIKEGQLLIQQVSNHEFKVVRLLSTDPMAYLN
ncbi:hypothetical protein KHA80_20155 [Anaerobacillus sp. HL2]|nr:hypothetical protein KHA80_20155 [Anaerobacillus sp. HL2]